MQPVVRQREERRSEVLLERSEVKVQLVNAITCPLHIRHLLYGRSQWWLLS